MPTRPRSRKVSRSATERRTGASGSGTRGPDARPGQDPAGIVIDERLEILEFFGHTGDFLDLPVGEPRFNVREMASPGVAAAIMRAIRSNRGRGGWVRRREVLFERNGVARTATLEVTPQSKSFRGPRTFQVRFDEPLTAGRTERASSSSTFEPAGSVARRGYRPARGGISKLPEPQDDAAELQAAYLDLEAAHSSLEASNQELVAVNLELAALNGELEDSNRCLLIALEERDREENRRRALEERMIQKQKLESLGVMAGGVAHDFNNILTSIIGHAELLIEGSPEGCAQREFASEVEGAGLRAANLVKQMLAYSGSGHFDLERVNICSIVGDVASLVESNLREGVRVEYRLQENVPEIDADASQIQQVLLNLVSNASHAIGRDGGFVSVGVRPAFGKDLERAQIHFGSASPARSYVSLQVSDSGCGMDEQTKSRIFEPFFTTREDGHGLGLAAVLGIVRGHAGSVRVDSGIGIGTTVEVFFPVPDRISPKSTAALPAPELPLRGTILVVDDQDAVRSAASGILRSAGMTVLTADSGPEAIAAIHGGDGEVSVVLLDLTMPGMDGRETLRQIRTLWARLPVVISSGYDRRGITPRFDNFPNLSFLQKPYRKAQLLARIREAMKGVGEGSELEAQER